MTNSGTNQQRRLWTAPRSNALTSRRRPIAERSATIARELGAHCVFSFVVTLSQLLPTADVGGDELDKPNLVPAGWDPVVAGDVVMKRLVNVTAPQVKGAHDAEFDCVGDTAYIVGVHRSVFNIDVSRDGKMWQRKYRFETTKSFQYPTFHEHDGASWLCVTQGDSSPSREERIMFGRLERVGTFHRNDQRHG